MCLDLLLLSHITPARVCVFSSPFVELTIQVNDFRSPPTNSYKVSHASHPTKVNYHLTAKPTNPGILLISHFHTQRNLSKSTLRSHSKKY